MTKSCRMVRASWGSVTHNQERNRSYGVLGSNEGAGAEYAPDLADPHADPEGGHAGPHDLDGLIAGYEPLVQLRTVAQDDFDECQRVAGRNLLIMKVLSVKVVAIIEAQLSDDDSIMKDLECRPSRRAASRAS